MKAIVTGGAGFIGSNLVEHLIVAGHQVRVIDNLVTGSVTNFNAIRNSPLLEIVKADLLDHDLLKELFTGFSVVFHLAANADVRFGALHPRRDLEQNTICTSNVLEAMRICGVGRIVFASTGSIYGEPAVFPTPENAPFPVQTSLYGASKLAAEGLIEAYSEAFGIQALVFRFVSILGKGYSHGHVLDFYNQLIDHPDKLHVLGDGSQRKSYLDVKDCIDAIMLALDHLAAGVEIYNLGTDETCTVNDSIGWICGHLGLNPSIDFSGGSRGWVGDSPFIFLDCSRIRALGWRPRLTIREGIINTVGHLVAQRGLLLKSNPSD